MEFLIVVYFKYKNYAYLFLWFPFTLLKELIEFGLNVLFNGGLKILY